MSDSAGDEKKRSIHPNSIKNLKRFGKEIPAKGGPGRPPGPTNASFLKKFFKTKIPNPDEAKVFLRGKKATTREIVLLKQLQKAMGGDIDAANFCFKFMGELPKETKTLDVSGILGVGANSPIQVEIIDEDE
jgi:hypothetical protein